MKSRRYIISVLASSAVMLVSVPHATAVEGPTLSSAQQEQVYNSLVSMGLSTTEASQYSTDSDVVPYVATSSGSEVQSGGDISALPVEEPGKDGPTTPPPAGAPQAIGSDCTGRTGWVQRSQYLNNVWGQRLITTTLKTTFCWNGSRVTYASSSQTYSRTTLGAGAGWRVSSWNFSEGWYGYNGRTNGGVKTVSQANLDACILKIGCHSDGTTVMRTYSHYNGTWSASGYSQ